MDTKLQKFVSWILLFAGVIIIFWTLYSSYNIFTTQAAAPEIFKIEKKETALPQKGTTQDLQAQMEKMVGEQLKGMLPTDFLPQLLNLISWSIFAGISIFAGSQISSLGIKLIKK